MEKVCDFKILAGRVYQGFLPWRSCCGFGPLTPGTPSVAFRASIFLSSSFSLSLLFNFCLVKILYLLSLHFTSLPLSTFTPLQPYSRCPYHFCLPDDANSFPMIPALSCLPFLTASLKALLPSVFPSGPKLCLLLRLPVGCFSAHLSTSLFLPLSFIFLALLFGCSLGLSQLLLQ